MEELEGGPKNFSIARYMNDHIYMLGGESVDVALELDDENAILYIKDWFGEAARIRYKDGKTHASVRSDENALYFWVMQYSDCVKAVSPSSFVKKVKEGLLSAYRRYEKDD